MDFGKLLQVDHVDFSLRPEPAANAAVLEAAMASRREPPRLYIGPTGYNTREWVGKWYPAGTREKDFLLQYGRQFNTIEHNTTHYRIPDTATLERWVREVPDDFRYCPKVPQVLSHARDLGIGNALMREFCARMADFGPKMGVCFLQLPPYFEPKNLPVLQAFVDKWPQSVPLAVEVRHEDFFKQSAATLAFFSLLHAQGVHAVITEVSGRRDVSHMRLSSPQVLVRFVGNALHPSDYSRIDAWALRLKDWFDAGLHAAYFFTHEPDNILAPDLAAYALNVFSSVMPAVQMRGPALVPPVAEQGRLF